MTKARCTGCDWIVAISPTGIALSHGWVDFGECPGTGQQAESPLHPEAKHPTKEQMK